MSVKRVKLSDYRKIAQDEALQDCQYEKGLLKTMIVVFIGVIALCLVVIAFQTKTP